MLDGIPHRHICWCCLYSFSILIFYSLFIQKQFFKGKNTGKVYGIDGLACLSRTFTLQYAIYEMQVRQITWILYLNIMHTHSHTSIRLVWSGGRKKGDGGDKTNAGTHNKCCRRVTHTHTCIPFFSSLWPHISSYVVFKQNADATRTQWVNRIDVVSMHYIYCYYYQYTYYIVYYTNAFCVVQNHSSTLILLLYLYHSLFSLFSDMILFLTG